MDGALIGATLVELGAAERGNLGLQQVLEPTAHDLRDQGASGCALHELVQLGGATMGDGHRPAHPGVPTNSAPSALDSRGAPPFSTTEN